MNLFTFSHLSNFRTNNASFIELLQVLLMFAGIIIVLYVLIGLIQDLVKRIGG